MGIPGVISVSHCNSQPLLEVPMFPFNRISLRMKISYTLHVDPHALGHLTNDGGEELGSVVTSDKFWRSILQENFVGEDLCDGFCCTPAHWE